MEGMYFWSKRDFGRAVVCQRYWFRSRVGEGGYTNNEVLSRYEGPDDVPVLGFALSRESALKCRRIASGHLAYQDRTQE